MNDIRLEQVTIFVLGTMGELARRGLVTMGDGATCLTDHGQQQFQALKESGFSASTDEIQAVTAGLVDAASDDIHARIEELTRQRDRLLEVCKKVTDWWDDDKCLVYSVIDDIRTAIEDVEKGEVK